MFLHLQMRSRLIFFLDELLFESLKNLLIIFPLTTLLSSIFVYLRKIAPNIMYFLVFLGEDLLLRFNLLLQFLDPIFPI